MNKITLDPRQISILESASAAFAAYGFRKTSMDDIARGAGMSRPAVYLHYKNKEAIFRSLVTSYYILSAQEVQVRLEQDLPLVELLEQAFAAQGGTAIETMMNSPHGMEILDAGSSVAADIIEEGEARLRQIYSDWLSGQMESGRVRMAAEPAETAAAFCAALKGVKMTAPDYQTYSRTIALMARLFGAGLAPSQN